MSSNPSIAAPLVVSVLVLVGCAGTAELLRADAHGGALSLSGSYSARAAQARLLMSSHCRGKYEIAPVVDGGDRRYPAPSQDTLTFECTGMRAAQQAPETAGIALAPPPVPSAPAGPSSTGEALETATPATVEPVPAESTLPPAPDVTAPVAASTASTHEDPSSLSAPHPTLAHHATHPDAQRRE